MTERITGVAIRNGTTVRSMPAPNRHHNVMREIEALGKSVELHGEQGFCTDRRRFVSREEALLIALAAGQMKPRLPGQYDGPKLFSEDVW